jgi:hypothetical protein
MARYSSKDRPNGLVGVRASTEGKSIQIALVGPQMGLDQLPVTLRSPWYGSLLKTNPGNESRACRMRSPDRNVVCVVDRNNNHESVEKASECVVVRAHCIG